MPAELFGCRLSKTKTSRVGSLYLPVRLVSFQAHRLLSCALAKTIDKGCFTEDRDASSNPTLWPTLSPDHYRTGPTPSGATTPSGAMLRLAYLAFLYLWHGGRWSTRSEELTAEGSDDEEEASSSTTASAAVQASIVNSSPRESSAALAPAAGSRLQHRLAGGTTAPSSSAVGGVQSTSSSGESDEDCLKKKLKRISIVDKLTALTVLTSTVSDLDLFADWYFLNQGLQGESELIYKVTLAFSVVGTIMYLLITFEFHMVSKVWTLYRGMPLNPLQHVPLGWQLLINVVVEDIPQLVITLITSPTSTAGVLNIATAVFALLAKAAEGYETRKDLPMSSQLRMVEEDPRIVWRMMVQRRTAEQLAAQAARLTVLVNRFRRDRNEKQRQVLAFQVMQASTPEVLERELSDMRNILDVQNLELGDCGLKGGYFSRSSTYIGMPVGVCEDPKYTHATSPPAATTAPQK